MDLNTATPAELAIHNALVEVEKVGCDELLTDAVMCLMQAQTKLEEFLRKKQS